MPEQILETSVVTVFEANIAIIDDAFKVSSLVQDHFIASLNSAISSPGITRSQAQLITRAREALENIRETSISRAESEVLSSLYRFAIISVVAVAEQLLKSVFNGLLLKNLETINKPDRLSIELQTLKDKHFSTDRQFWVTQILDELYGTKNAQEKLNFQNIKAIQSLFNEYFGLNIADANGYSAIEKKVHLYYQIRHILVHNAGYVDERFLHNLEVANIPISDYSVGALVAVGRSQYEDCKQSFSSLFYIIEALAERMSLEIVLD